MNPTNISRATASTIRPTSNPMIPFDSVSPIAPTMITSIGVLRPRAEAALGFLDHLLDNEGTIIGGWQKVDDTLPQSAAGATRPLLSRQRLDLLNGFCAILRSG